MSEQPYGNPQLVVAEAKRREVYDRNVFGWSLRDRIRRAIAREFSFYLIGPFANNFAIAQEFAKEGQVEPTQWYLRLSMQCDRRAREVLIGAYEKKVRSYDPLVAEERIRYGTGPLPERPSGGTPAYGVLQYNYARTLAELQGTEQPAAVDNYGRPFFSEPDIL